VLKLSLISTLLRHQCNRCTVAMPRRGVSSASSRFIQHQHPVESEGIVLKPANTARVLILTDFY